MLFLRSWFEEYIDLSGYTNKQLADIITTKSSEVEEVRVISDYFEGKVVVGQIKNLKKHEDADTLNVFDVMIGEGKSIQIVSAAPNVAEDLLVPVALEGARLPNGLVIAPRKMRGIESQGMCCGMSELMVETEISVGLWELESEFGKVQKAVKLGQSICEAFPEYFPTETVFDIKVLPNRIGVFGSYLGMALEIAFCLENKGLLKRKASRILDPEIFLDDVKDRFIFKQNLVKRNAVSFRDTTSYTKSFSLFDVNYVLQTNYILDKELQKRMYLTGINMIGGLADVSNYLLYDVGQPTHFFSAEKVTQLSGGADIDWRIERLEKETNFEGLGKLKNTTLPKNIRVIKDSAENILAVPAVTGGRSSSMETNEKQFILEIANFDSEEVSRTSFALKYRSDGSKIWSGSVNQELLFVTLLHLQELMGENIDISPILFWSAKSGRVETIQEFLAENLNQRIELDLAYIADRLDGRGFKYWKPILEQKLELIGKYEYGILTTEAFYSNLQTQEDVLEELMRLIGFDGLESQQLTLTSGQKNDKTWTKLLQIKELMVLYGFDEVMTRPFVGESKLVDRSLVSSVIKPYRTTEPYLRDSLLFSLLDCIALNIKEGYKEPRVFEVNKVFMQVAGIIKESKELEAVFVCEDPYLATSLARDLWKKTSRKEILDYPQNSNLSDRIGKGFSIQTKGENDTWICVKEISNNLKKQHNLPLTKKIWSVSMAFDQWDGTIFGYKDFADESEFPGVRRSFNLVVKDDKLNSEVIKNIESIAVEDIRTRITPEERVLIDGKNILTVKVELISYSRTLTSEDIAGFEMMMKLELDKIGVNLKN
jgi:phenylalanyl-tRNA synthetase beta chain